MTEKIQGIISEMKDKGRKKGRNEERKSIIKKLLKKYSPEEVSKILDMDKTTLQNIIQK